MGLLGVLDFLFVNHACHSIITRGASVQLVFGFEVCQPRPKNEQSRRVASTRSTNSRSQLKVQQDYQTKLNDRLYLRLCPLPQYAILLTMVLTTFIKYLLHTIDLQSENPWDNKAVYMLYTELFTGIERHLCSAESEQLSFHLHNTQTCCFYSRLYQSAPVHCLYDHHDKGPHLPPVCHPAHVSGYEVSGCVVCLSAMCWFSTLHFVFLVRILIVHTLHEMGT